jgi:hypothetical protein
LGDGAEGMIEHVRDNKKIQSNEFKPAIGRTIAVSACVLAELFG